MRIGFGYDVHAFKEGRPLVLGGVNIPFSLGLDGHSDADVLIHALMDSMLGACALGDIGIHFPDTDMQYKNISSMKLLKRVAELINDSGYYLVNADITLIAQQPKITPYASEMRKNIAEILCVSPERISIKATTEEHLGFTGTMQGIKCCSVCLLEKCSQQIKENS